MPTSASGSTVGKAGTRKVVLPTSIVAVHAKTAANASVPTSPSSLSHTFALPSVPRIKLSVRATPPVQPHASGSASSPVPIKRKVGRPRKSDLLHQPPPPRKAARARITYNDHDDGNDSSDLTPADDGEDSEDMTPKRRPVGRPKNSDKAKGKGKESVARKKARTSAAASPQAESSAAAISRASVPGPAGRQRKRATKLEDAGRRRARDAKFDVTEDAFAGSIPAQGAFHIRSFLDSDSGSSFGDDESDHNMSPADLAALEGLMHESDDDETRGLPEAFAGQDIEDLAYGAPSAEVDIEREALAGWFEEEDEEMFISHLSGSEADQQSQSSAHDSPANSDMGWSSSQSEPEDQVDEFGFPIPLSNSHLLREQDGDAPGLVLMENWDGKLVLYQTKPPRTKNHSGSRGSRTNGSVAGSTVAPSASDQLENGDRDLHLMIDPEAAEYDEDATSSEWSGESDEMDGDTTDSMDEEDMPMLDSPAMQELIDQQTRLPSPPSADGLIGEALNEPTGMAPAIVVTDTSMVSVETTPAMSFASTPATASTSQLPSFTTDITSVPQTPAAAVPVMGTFLPTSTDPAQHAVIDGSGTSTKSPFTHRRRSRKNRAGSMSSVGGRSSSMSTLDRKRKSNSVALSSTDPFGGPPVIQTISKKARYTSIPGHPKYVQAQQRIEEDNEGTSTEEEEEVGEFDLEDMLDPALLQQLATTGGQAGQGGEHMRHLIRFDRVPVSAYIQRNFGSRERYDVAPQPQAQAHSSPSQQVSRGRSPPRRTLGRMEAPAILPVAEGAATMLMAAQTRIVVSPAMEAVDRQVDSLQT